MTFKDFTDIYGTNTTTNFQLIKYAKELKIPNFYCLMRDELNEIKTDNFNVIINLHKSNQKGAHWSCFTPNYFFDSYGLPPTKEVKDFLKHGEVYKTRGYAEFSTFQLQKFNENNCGQFCLYVLDRLNNGYNFNETILSLKNEC